MARRAVRKPKTVETLRHDEASRPNIPTAEFHSAMAEEQKAPRPAIYKRNRDLDPQLVWRGKDEQDADDLTVHAPPLYIQEKVHPKALVDDLLRQTEARRDGEADAAPDLFADFNGLLSEDAWTEFYRHDANWSNRMILGDSLQVMASLAEREGLRGKVQCIYIDPPYGIRFNSNFQWSTTSRDVRDGRAGHITREPEQVKAFRDTWRDGIHSYLAWLRDRLTLARELLPESGSVFVQIGDENVHRVRALMDEVFGDENFIAKITIRVKSPLSVSDLARTTDFLVWYSRSKVTLKFCKPQIEKQLDQHSEFSLAMTEFGEVINHRKAEDESQLIRYFTAQNLDSSGYTQSCMCDYNIQGKTYTYPKGKSWKTHRDGMARLDKAGRLHPLKTSLRWRYFYDDAPSEVISDIWSDTFATTDKVYVVQTSEAVIERCILMTTDPGDLVLDPTCGSGTTAYVAERWGRRWITIDTSRVALALARARIMGARYPWYLLADSPEGQHKEAEITRRAPSEASTGGDIRQGFVYERVPHITLKSIANNAEINTIWETWQETLEPLRSSLNAALDTVWEEWQIPREAGDDWPEETTTVYTAWWEARIARQKEIDALIAARADTEYLYDKPYEDSARIRVAGPFTVESVAPHRMLAVDENDELFSMAGENGPCTDEAPDFTATIIENLKTAGVQQADKQDRITLSSLVPWPGSYICAEGRYWEADGKDNHAERRAGIFVGPEFGTVARPDLVAAAREGLVACAFNYDAHAGEMRTLGPIPVLKARMNADLHMAGELKNTGKGNLFVVFGEPDIELLDAGDDRLQVRINGVDVFHPTTGEVRSDGPDDIACWFVDTDYNEESFFVRQAYFPGANAPYKALRTTLKAEIDAEAWATLNEDTSRPFPRPPGGSRSRSSTIWATRS